MGAGSFVSCGAGDDIGALLSVVFGFCALDNVATDLTSAMAQFNGMGHPRIAFLCSRRVARHAAQRRTARFSRVGPLPRSAVDDKGGDTLDSACGYAAGWGGVLRYLSRQLHPLL